MATWAEQLRDQVAGIIEGANKIKAGLDALGAGLDLLGTAEGRARVKTRLEAEDNLPAAATLRDLEQIVEAGVKEAQEEPTP